MEVHAISLESVESSLEETQVQSVPAKDIAATFQSDYIDLISKPLGTRILSFSDEWFASAENLINPLSPIRKENTFTYAGAWYDGWETRRHNSAAFDYVVFRLGVASGRISGVEIDTAFFNGNHAPEIAVQGYLDRDAMIALNEPTDRNSDGEQSSADTRMDHVVTDVGFDEWEDILPRQECGPSCRQAWKVAPQVQQKEYTHIRLQMFPDGGIARFRLYGTVVPRFPALNAAGAATGTTTDPSSDIIDLAATVNGGRCIKVSDQHFGAGGNLLLPGRGVDMGDGWETKRSRGVHIDWAIIRLGVPGQIERIIVDTAHFRGNFPQKVQMFAAAAAPRSTSDAESSGNGGNPRHDDHDAWVQILAPTPTGPDREHEYGLELLDHVRDKTYSHVKLVIIPDGGVKRLRILGKRTSI